MSKRNKLHRRVGDGSSHYARQIRNLQIEVERLQQYFSALPGKALPPEWYSVAYEEDNNVLQRHRAELDAVLATPITDENELDRLYLAFQAVLRGSEAVITERLRPYLNELPFGQNSLPVVDIGCGRGEFLSLLREKNILTVGIEPNEVEVRTLRDKGFTVHQTDGNSYLRSVSDSSLGAVTAFHVIEHLPYEDLREFLKLAYAKLAPGGFLLVETPNPYCLSLFRTFYLDPTHHHPLPIDLIAIMFRFYGFQKLHAFFHSPLHTVGVPSDPHGYYLDWALSGIKPAP